ncbi:MAG TPA: NAD(+) diphosphatase [Byssovorax sp.]
MRFVPGTSSALLHDRRSWFVVHAKGVVVRREGERVLFPTEAEALAMGARVDDADRLGSLDDADALAVPLAGDVAGPFEPLGLRALAALVDGGLFGVIVRALHAADWLTTSRFCGRCGARTARVADERCMACPACGLHLYPRISPAIITLVRKGDLALLASNAKFPGAFYSTLAGFADIGESLEQTLAREVHEETGVRVRDVRYFGSQPWPFPNSLMIGFTAAWESGEIVVDPKELSDAKWFDVDALPVIPPRLSIARQLIDAWIADVRATRA